MNDPAVALLTIGVFAILIYACRAALANWWYDWLDKMDNYDEPPPLPEPPVPTTAQLAAQIEVKPETPAEPPKP